MWEAHVVKKEPGKSALPTQLGHRGAKICHKDLSGQSLNQTELKTRSPAILNEQGMTKQKNPNGAE